MILAPAPASGSAPEIFRRRLWLVGGFALALRLLDLGRRELWVDEAFTWHFAQKVGQPGFGELIRLEATPPVYYGLIGGLMRIFGESDWLIRLPSAIFGALSVMLVALLGEKLGWRQAGLAGALLLAFHPWHLFISQEARVYPLLLLLLLVLALATWRALETDTGADWVKVAAVLTLCLYCHFFGIFIGAAAAVAVMALGRNLRSRLRGLAALAGACLLFTPYVLVVLPSLAGSGANWSHDLFYSTWPGEGSLARVVEGHLIGARYNIIHRELMQPDPPWQLRWPAVVAQTLLLAAAIYKAWRPGGDRRGVAFVSIFYLVPFMVPWATLFTGKNFFLVGRHDFMVLGPLCLLLGAGFVQLRQKWKALAWLLLIPVVAAGLFRHACLYFRPADLSATEHGRYLAAAATPEDLIVCFGIKRLLGERYSILAGGRLTFESFPAEIDRHPGWSDPRPLLRRLPELQEEARSRVRQRIGKGRIVTFERYLGKGPEASPPDWQVDQLFVTALKEAGWRLESRDDIHKVRIWSSP